MPQLIPVDNDPFANAPTLVPVDHDPFASAGPSPDKYQQEALTEAAKLHAAGGDASYGLAGRFLNGALFQGLPTIAAAAETPIEMARHGTLSPIEGYDYAKAKENLALQQSSANLGGLGTAADIAGGLTSGTSLAKAGVTFAKDGAGLFSNAARMAGDGAGYGLLSGLLGGGDSLKDRGAAAVRGGLIGGATGGLLPLIASGAATAAAPVTSNIRARLDPTGFATNQLARAVSESGQTVPALQGAIDDATAAGQPSFTLADAMGNPGQRMLSTVTRSPGAGRTDAVNFLENRQAGQGRDLTSQIVQGLDAPDTAAQRTASLTAQRSADAAANYGAARASAGAVDVSPAIQMADNFLTPGAASVMNPGSSVADDSIEGAMRKARSFIAGRNGEQISDFPTALRAKQEMDNLIDRGSPAQQRMLIPMRNTLDDQLAAASPQYAGARNIFRQQSQAIDAIGVGKAAAMRGRPEDNIPIFNAMPPDQQSAFRAGYADPLIEGITNAAPGVNKARGLLNDGTRAELDATSLFNGPYQPGASTQLQQGIDRSNTMFETRRQAIGGSQTADNLADQSALALDPSMIMHLATGNVGGVVRGAIRAAGNGLTGSTPQVRSELGRLLLMHGPSANVGAALAPIMNNRAATQAMLRALASGGLDALGNVNAQRNALPQR